VCLAAGATRSGEAAAGVMARCRRTTRPGRRAAIKARIKQEPPAIRRVLEGLEVDEDVPPHRAAKKQGGGGAGLSLSLMKYQSSRHDGRTFVARRAWELRHLYERGRGLWLSTGWVVRGDRLVQQRWGGEDEGEEEEEEEEEGEEEG